MMERWCSPLIHLTTCATYFCMPMGTYRFEYRLRSFPTLPHLSLTRFLSTRNYFT